MYGVSIRSNPPHKKTKLLCLLSCLSKRAVEQTVEMQVSRKLMKLRLYYCNVTCHLVIDDITLPMCGETIGHQWIPVARGHWSWTLVVQCAAIPPPVDSPHKSSAWWFFMFALTSYLTNNRAASELKSLDAYAMPLLCVICQSDILHGWTSGWLRCRYTETESLTGRIKYKEHRFDLCDNQSHVTMAA